MPLTKLASNVTTEQMCRFERTWLLKTLLSSLDSSLPPPLANPNTAGAPEVRGGGEAQSEAGARRPEERQGHQPRHLRQLPGGRRPAVLRPLSCSLPPPVLVSPAPDACTGRLRGRIRLVSPSPRVELAPPEADMNAAVHEGARRAAPAHRRTHIPARV